MSPDNSGLTVTNAEKSLALAMILFPGEEWARKSIFKSGMQFLT
jgi:hypothetical protein